MIAVNRKVCRQVLYVMQMWTQKFFVGRHKISFVTKNVLSTYGKLYNVKCV